MLHTILTYIHTYQKSRFSLALKNSPIDISGRHLYIVKKLTFKVAMASLVSRIILSVPRRHLALSAVRLADKRKLFLLTTLNFMLRNVNFQIPIIPLDFASISISYQFKYI